MDTLNPLTWSWVSGTFWSCRKRGETKKGEHGGCSGRVSLHARGKVSEGKSLQPWQSPWCAFIFVYLCVSIWISVCILAWLCVYTMNVCLSQMSGSCNEVGSQSLLFKLPLMSPGWREVLELIKFAWEPKSWQRWGAQLEVAHPTSSCAHTYTAPLLFPHLHIRPTGGISLQERRPE